MMDRPNGIVLRTLLLGMLLLLLMSASATQAQPPEMMDEERQERFRERIEMMRIWKLTELLDLDQDRAAVFFPRYRTYITSQDSIERRMRRIDDAIDSGLRGTGEIDYKKMIAMSRELEQAQLETRKKFVDRNADLLNSREQAALILFERRFHERLWQMMHEVQREEGEPPYGPQYRHRRGPGGPPDTDVRPDGEPKPDTPGMKDR